MGRFFTNSGAESSECALKVVRKTKKTGKIVSLSRISRQNDEVTQHNGI